MAFLYRYTTAEDARERIRRLFDQIRASFAFVESVIVEFEPGDCTKYELIITRTKREMIYSICNNCQQVVEVGIDAVADPVLLNFRYPTNPSVRCLIAEIHNWLVHQQDTGYFDWIAGRALCSAIQRVADTCP